MAPPWVPNVILDPSTCCLSTLPLITPAGLLLRYVKLHWIGVKYWRDVAKSAKAGRALLDRVDGLEGGARAITKVVADQWAAENQLPEYPLQTDDKAGHMTTTADELGYVQRYGETGRGIADNAAAVRAELDKAIAGWDAAVEQAKGTDNFTRAAAWEAITVLDLSFSKDGAGFRAYLVAARDEAVRLERAARMKEFHAAHILGEWTPGWYQPPTPRD